MPQNNDNKTVFLHPQEMTTPEGADILERSGQAAEKNFAARPGNHPVAQDTASQKSWIEIELVDQRGQPVKNKKFTLRLPNGEIFEGKTDENGVAGIDNIDPGNCRLSFADFRFVDNDA